MPPVTSTVPAPNDTGPSGVSMRSSRGARSVPSRSASCGSSAQQDLGRVVEIEQPEAAGMLGLRAAHEPPDGGTGEVGRLSRRRRG